MSETAPSASALYSPGSLGALELPNRVVMAPLTRCRAGASGVPGDLAIEYYRQRAGVGLIISEGCHPDPGSQGWFGAAGIADEHQAAGWGRVIDAVHGAGGRIVVQLQHSGRAAHPDINGGRRVLAPSAVPIDGTVFNGETDVPFRTPEAMTATEVQDAIVSIVDAARRAVGAGADGVEVHSANGYLLHQFLSPAANVRTDSYGGSPQHRARFVVEVVTAVAEAVGADRVGLRISPEVAINDVFETDRDDVLTTYGTLLDQVRPLGLAYLSVLHTEPDGDLVQQLRRRFGGPVIVNSGFLGPQTTRTQAERWVDDGAADAVAVGRAVLANPDLVERWQGGHPENEPRQRSFYTPTADGYTDYPTLNER